MKSHASAPQVLPDADVVLIGGGIMSATLGSMLAELDPKMRILVFGETDANYLRQRVETLRRNPMFADMEFTTDRSQIANWAPLTMEGRAGDGEPLAAARDLRGTDVDFGALTRALTSIISARAHNEIRTGHEVTGLQSTAEGWIVSGKSPTGTFSISAKQVFVGTGGFRLSDFFTTLRPDNLHVIAAAGLQNLDLVKFLVKELAASPKKKFAQLRRYYPKARFNEWELVPAGQRAQLVKPDPKKIGVLQQGTELVVGADGSTAGLLGASPGASTAVPIMLDLLRAAFPARWHRSWKEVMTQAIPDIDRSEWSTEAVTNSFACTDEALGLGSDAQESGNEAHKTGNSARKWDRLREGTPVTSRLIGGITHMKAFSVVAITVCTEANSDIMWSAPPIVRKLTLCAVSPGEHWQSVQPSL